ncbi:alpha/beta-hydrolase [Aureobasidium sp. EXF-10727]|nr:alpha/beta-hydrolase [Aureobasidium sp. EXF-10727]
MQYTVITSLLAAPLLALAQFPPPVEYSNILKSPINENITVAYKTPPAGTCTTAFSTQKQFTGYIGLPPFTLQPIQQNYSINTFFWFTEARQSPETAPLTIWINGGPGSSSLIGMFAENGPCEVIQMADGSYGTQTRMWGWDRSSNVLFIDQPTQVGLSYDSLTNLTYDLFEDQYLPYDFQNDTSGNTRPAYALMNGTFSSGDPEFTTNTTDISARAAWHFLQSFLAAFPQYNPGVRPNSSHVSTTGVNLFAESYGGTYGPTFANYFEEQNAKRDNGTLPKNSTLEIKLTSLGIVNGLIDSLVQDYYYATFAYNNTFGIQTISQTDELNLIEQYNNQCSKQTNLCRAIANGTDPEGEGDNMRANIACQAAVYNCNSLMSPFQRSNLSVYDIRVKNPSPDPSNAYLEYLNTASVQKAIGARVNYTTSSSAVMNAFIRTGDSIRGGQIQEIANLLRAGVRVSLMYGDADYICNWKGGEAASFAVAAALSDFPSNGSTPSYLTGWNSAGYADIVVNASYVGGAVRQFGNFSFSRIYDAGHMVPFYQPETAFTVFTRIIDGTEISTGEPIDLSNFKSSGPMNSTHTNSPLAKQPAPTCWIRAMQDTCSADQIEDMQEGKGIVAGGIWYSNSKQYSAPSSTVTAGKPGTPVTSSSTSSKSTSGSTTSTVALTGVFTATATPSPTQGAASGTHGAMHKWIQSLLVLCALAV